MNHPRKVLRQTAVGVLFLSLILLAAGRSPMARAADETADLAADIVQFSGASGGVCSVIGAEDADLGIELASRGSFTVQNLYRDADDCKNAKDAIRSEGLCGPVSARQMDLPHLPYTENLVDILVLDGWTAMQRKGLTAEEMLRVISPLGTAYVGGTNGRTQALKNDLKKAGAKDIEVVEHGGRWVRFKKAWPENIDEWTHFLHSANGNPVAQDTEFGPARRVQWKAGPKWMRSHETDSSVSTMVTARGRLFYIANKAPISLAGNHALPDKWFLIARDAFNGVTLWQVPIRRWGWREWKQSWFTSRPGHIPLNLEKRLVAVGDDVFVTLGYNAPVSRLDARTGNIEQTYRGTEKTAEILYHDGTLYLTALRGDACKVMAVDASSGDTLWTSNDTYEGTKTDYVKLQAMRGSMKVDHIDPTLNTATDGDIISFLDQGQLVALDAGTGEEKWRTEFPMKKSDLGAGGIDNSEGNLWMGTVIVKDGVVVHASPNRLGAFAADSGKQLWTAPKKYLGHLWFEWKDVFVIDGRVWTWSANLESGKLKGGGGSRWPATVKGYDLHTGEVTKEVDLKNIFKTHHHHRCYRNKATSRYILASRRGSEYISLDGGPHVVDNWVRGICHLGMMPANGMQYVPRHPCRCYGEEKLRGWNVLAPTPDDKPVREDDSDPKLVRGEAFDAADGPKADATEWTSFRHDGRRTGATKATVPGELKRSWRVRVGRKISSPTVANGKVFTALVDQHMVSALDADSGRELWAFAAGARVDSPPTYYRGRVIFGSADGWVYCLRADDGELAWKFRAAPGERFVGAHGQLESAWPVHGSVLVKDGTVYVCAGRSTHLDGGLRLYALDAETGRVQHRRTMEGPRYTSENIEQNHGNPQGLLPDLMISQGNKIYMHGQGFKKNLENAGGRPSMRVPGSSMLDDSYFKRAPWRMAGEYARLLVHDDRNAFYVRQFDSMRGLDPSVYFTPGNKGYMLFSKNTKKGKRQWFQRVPVRIRAMVQTSDVLFVAGPPDAIPDEDPLGPYEGRYGGKLHAVNASTGEKLAEYELPSPPVFNGVAAVPGRLYITEKGGFVSCYAGKKPGDGRASR